jgi:hypothetical protein
MQFRIVMMGSLIALAIASNAYARPQGTTGTAVARCPQEDLACPSRVVANQDRERNLSEQPVDLRSWLYNRKASEEPPAQRDDASGSADLMVVHPAGNVVWVRW